MDLAIIVVSYNTRELTAGCLESAYRDLESSKLMGHIWVIDNASPDDSAEMVAERFPQATLIAQDTNPGFAVATNVGIRAALAQDPAPRYVMLLNPDTIVRRGALSALISFMDETPSAGAAGARLYYGDGSFQHSAFRFPSLSMAFLDFWMINHRLLDSRLNGRYPRRLYESGEPFAIDHPLGATMCIRRETLAEVGLLDEGFFMYCEEIDWCFRAKAAGWGIYCVPRSEVVHLGGQSTGQFRAGMFQALWESRFRLFAKHYGRLYQWLVRWIVRAGLRRELARLESQLSAGEIMPDEAERRRRAYQAVMAM
ncbi:MAG: glycosyltransferase family 2 protein [Anaerolineae bacterium]